MRPFAFARPDDPEEAVALATSRPGAVYVAGGTNLVDLMKLGAARPTLLVDISRLRLGGIEPMGNGGIRIGAVERNSDVAADRFVRGRYPLLSQALLAGASGQIRNLATVGGNLLQRTRCAYFQDVTKPCNKRRPGSGCPARAGDHRNLAVLGTSSACIATHPSDMAVALAALDGVAVVRTADAVLRIPVDELHRLPGDEPSRDTVLPPGALIEGVELPPPLAGVQAYRKVRDRASFAFGVVSLAAVLAVDGEGVVTDVQLAFGAVAPKPWRGRRAEEALRGRELTGPAIVAAVDRELGDAAPLPGNAFKLPLMRRLAVRTLLDLAAR